MYIKNSDGGFTKAKPAQIVEEAQRVLHRAYPKKTTFKADSTMTSKNFASIFLALRASEAFGVMFLNNQHQLIVAEIMFTGTIDSGPVYPREVVKRALDLNAAALILMHNHPSGNLNASDADKRITERLVDACGLVEIRILDHIIVSSEGAMSFAEKGLM